MVLEDDLRRILRDEPDRVVWVVGNGVPQGALRGTPSEPYTSWTGLLRSGLRRIHELGRINPEELDNHERLLGHDSLTPRVAEKIAQELGAPMRGEFRRWLRETVGGFVDHLADRAVLDALADHQRRGGLLATTNYDFLLETVTGLPTATWRSPADVERALRGDEPQVLHLHGAWRWPDSVVLGIRSYADVARDKHARALLTTLGTNRIFVFVGCDADLRDPNMGAFLRWTATAYAGSEYRHFRLCRKSELESLRREHPDEQRIFPLSYGDDHAALAPFLRSLLPPGARPLHAAPAPVQPPPPKNRVRPRRGPTVCHHQHLSTSRGHRLPCYPPRVGPQRHPLRFRGQNLFERVVPEVRAAHTAVRRRRADRHTRRPRPPTPRPAPRPDLRVFERSPAPARAHRRVGAVCRR